IIFATPPPSASIPSESGVTSSSSKSSVAADPPARICACTAAPSATTSSGFSSICRVFPLAFTSNKYPTTRQLLKLRPRNLPQIPLPTRQQHIQRRRLRSRQQNLRLNHRRANPLHRLAVPTNILTKIPGNIIQRNRNQQGVDIVPAQVRIPTRGDHLEDPLMQLQDRNIERPTAKVIHRNQAVFVLIQPISQRGRRRFIHQPQHLEARNPPSVLRSLPLRIIEVS